MRNMIASDIDGTLLDYNYIPGTVPAINYPLIRQLRQRTDRIVLVSNQGGLPFGVQGIVRKDGRKYPAPEDFIERLQHLDRAFEATSMFIAAIHICVFHPKAPESAMIFVQSELKDHLSSWPAFIYISASSRKPSAAMLVNASATCYYGDSDEDEQAAQAAGIEFVRVERFFE